MTELNDSSISNETLPVIGVDDETKTVPKIKKLGINGDYYEWIQEIKLHFESLSLWEFIDISSSTVLSNDPLGKKKEARCKRDLLLSLEGELKLLISHVPTARDMLKRIKITFVGGDISEKSKLLKQIQNLKYEGDFFIFFTRYQSLMTQISVRGGGINDTLIMQFLMKLPASLNATIYPYMKELEQNTNNGLDYEAKWNEIYEDLLNFLISCGWFKPKFKKKKESENFAMKGSIKCWLCGEEGHFRKNCPKKEKSSSEKTKD